MFSDLAISPMKGPLTLMVMIVCNNYEANAARQIALLKCVSTQLFSQTAHHDDRIDRHECSM